MNIEEIPLQVGGKDAQSFLQGQLANDIDKIKDGEWQLNAYCQHQGRIIALLWVSKQADGFYLFSPPDLQEIVLNRLKMFALNADVKFLAQPLPDESDQARPDPEKYPQIYLQTSEKFIPQDLNLDIDEVGVNFSKGCYPGQEVVARIKYLGKPKRRLYQFECDFKVLPLDELTTKDSPKPVGFVVNQIKSGFLATLKVAFEDSNIFINNQSVTLISMATF